MGQPAGWAGESARCGRRHDHVPQRRWPRIPLERCDRGADGASARLAPSGKPCPGRRRADVGCAVRLRAVRFPQRARAGCAGSRPILLSAQVAVDGGSRALERRDGPRRTYAGPCRRHLQGDGVDRNTARRIPDGGNPVRAAAPGRRTQLRALGLHLLVPENPARAPRPRAARSRAGRDDRAVPAQLFAIPGRGLPPPGRVRDGRHGRADSDQGRRCGERRSAREGARRQVARSHRRPRRHVGRASRAGADRARRVRRPHADAEPVACPTRRCGGHA